MGVLTKKSDVTAQWERYLAAQRSALAVTGVFERACNTGRSAAECRSAWAKVGEAQAALEAEWLAYQRIAPAKMRTR